jgi:hypothetical protein
LFNFFQITWITLVNNTIVPAPAPVDNGLSPSVINVLAMERNTTGDLVIKYAQGKIIEEFNTPV